MKRSSKKVKTKPAHAERPSDKQASEVFPEFTPQNWDPRIGKRHKQAGSIEKYRAMLQKVKHI